MPSRGERNNGGAPRAAASAAGHLDVLLWTWSRAEPDAHIVRPGLQVLALVEVVPPQYLGPRPPATGAHLRLGDVQPADLEMRLERRRFRDTCREKRQGEGRSFPVFRLVRRPRSTFAPASTRRALGPRPELVVLEPNLVTLLAVGAFLVAGGLFDIEWRRRTGFDEESLGRAAGLERPAETMVGPEPGAGSAPRPL